MASRIHQVTQHRSPLTGVEVVTLYSNHHFPRHSHDQFGIGLILSGGHRSWSAVGAVEAFAGDVIMVNPGEIHDGEPLGGEPRRWRMIYFDSGLLLPREVELKRPVARDPLLACRLMSTFHWLVDDEPDKFAFEEKLWRSLIGILRNHSTARLEQVGLSPSVRKARERLDAAPELPVSLAELAAICGVSRFQLLRGFAREVGMTPHAYLVQRRVLMARTLLGQGSSPTEAALAAGFADQSHMTRAFVRQFGVTPSRYRAAVAS